MLTVPNKYEQIEAFALQVITQCGSDAGEKNEPWIKSKSSSFCYR
jgi:hypothetical protein